MSISLGSSALTDLRLGSSAVSSAYLGTSLVYSSTPAAWTPAQLTGLKYYFTAGAGVTLNGNYASIWTDQVSGIQLSASVASDSYRPLYSSSVQIINNKPALYFTNTSSPYQRLEQQFASGLANSDDFTVIGIMVPTTSGVAGYQVYGGVGAVSAGSIFEIAMETSNPTAADQFAAYVNPNGGATTIQSGVGINSGVANWHAITYKASNGEVKQYVNSTTAVSTNTLSTNPYKGNLKLIAGDYSDGSDIGGIGLQNGWIMELIYLTSIPTPTELTNLNTYVSTYYAAPAGPTFPDQSLTTWTTTETAAWLSAGSTLTTSTYGYATSSVRIGSSDATSYKWYGAALASNGKIYCPPYNKNEWAIINTSNDTIATTGSVNNTNWGARYDKITNQVFAFGNGGTKINCTNDSASNLSGPSLYNGGAVQALDGNKLYTGPLYGNNAIYEYDISANTTSSVGATGGDRYPIGTLAANGKIFFPGGGGTQFTEYDPATSTLTNFGSFGGDYTGPMVAHYDGYIYCFPRFSNQNVIRLNPSTRATTTIHTLSISANIISMDTCIGLDGRIYVTRENGGVYWYDPYANTSGEIIMASSDTSFSGITMGMHGDLYVIPYSSLYFHKISLTTGAGAGADAIVQQYNFGGRMAWQ